MSRRVDKDHLDKWLDDGLHLPTRTLLLAGELDDDSVTYVAQRLHLLLASPAPLTVLLNSNGGAVDAALVLHDLLRGASDSGCHVTVRVTGAAQSAAVVVLQAGDTRELTPSGVVMYHPGTAGLEATPEPESEAMWRLYRRLGKLCDDVVYASMRQAEPGLSRSTFRRRVLRGLVAVGQEAVDYGLVDRVVEVT